jgi:gluconokinase
MFDGQARPLPALETMLPYKTNTTADGGFEIEPVQLIDTICEAVNGTLQKAGEQASRIRAVGMCSLVANVLGVDQHGEPTTPIFTWADTRCVAEAAELRRILDEEAVRQRTGCPIHTSYLPARFLWLRRNLPEAYERTALWLSLGEWLQLKLFGKAAQSFSVASWGGLLNRHALDWDEQLLDALQLDRQNLPPLVDVDHSFSGLRVEFARRWPVLRDVPWFPCVGDGAGGNLGSGCFWPDQVALQVGTSGAIRATIPGTASTIPSGIWCYRIDHQTSLLGGSLSEGGNVIGWLRDTLSIDDLSVFEEEAARLPPDSHGLTILPFLAGERSPGWHGEARGTISGLSLGTGPADILRAAEESIAYRFGIIYDVLKRAVPAPSLVVGSGGGFLKSGLWMQIIADVLDTAITASADPQASSRGTAMLALRSLGLVADLSTLPVALGKTYTPSKVNHGIYREAMERQIELYEKLVASSFVEGPKTGDC